ncbi:amidohydrolase family-domain-containing protein [Abortiporus biennis]|nr:amidohydrolase family-domain-containing protein [Abortiporus biennis]
MRKPNSASCEQVPGHLASSHLLVTSCYNPIQHVATSGMARRKQNHAGPPKLKQSSKSQSSGAVESSLKPPQPKPNRPSPLKRILLTLLLGGLSFVYTYYFASKSQEKLDKIKQAEVHTHLPESYALCTSEKGKIYTVAQNDTEWNVVDCFLVKQDRIGAVGNLDAIERAWDMYQNEQIKKFYGNEPKAKKPLKVFETKPGTVVLPGLADSHAHLVEYGFKIQLPLDKAHSLEDVLDIIESYVASHHPAPSTWIQGMGWDQTRWKNWRGGFPTADDLASRSTLADIPISLNRVDGHAIWVSRAALELAKESLPGHEWPKDEDVEKEGGKIIRDEDGEPNGVFVDNAMKLIPRPEFTQEQIEEYAINAMNDALRVGLTSVHDAGMTRASREVFERLAEEGRLPIRVYAMAATGGDEDLGPENLERLEEYGKDGRYDLRSVKIVADGALGSWGAALLEPYSDDPNTTGLMRYEDNVFKEMLEKYYKAGWGVNVHCIGDRANKLALDTFERLIKESKAKGEESPRVRIEHSQIMRTQDIERFGELGVIASVQPTHATSDMWYAELRLGPDRIKGAYAYQSLLRSSPINILPLGSDFPVEDINPLEGFFSAVYRTNREGDSPHGKNGWYINESLTRSQTLKGMTYDAAYASYHENDFGSLEVGKKADYVVLNTDIMVEAESGDVKGGEILNAKVLATIVDGRIQFGGI